MQKCKFAGTSETGSNIYDNLRSRDTSKVAEVKISCVENEITVLHLSVHRLPDLKRHA